MSTRPRTERDQVKVLVPPTGIRRRGAGWEARVYAAGQHASKTFPLATPFEHVIAWQEDERYRLRRDARPRSPLEGVLPRGFFAEDAKRYLAAVAAMPDLARRRKDIELWVIEFGARVRRTITAVEIRTVRDRWLTVGPKMTYRKATADRESSWEAVAVPLSGSTVNHRLRALSNLWAVLDGRRAPNPVREVPEAEETAALARAIPYDIIDRLLDAMPDRGRATRFLPRPEVSKTKLRLRVMMWTGLPQKQLGALRRAHVDFTTGTWVTTARKKGRGVEPARLPLLPEALEALRAFFDGGAEGAFSASGMRQSFLRAVEKLTPVLIAEGYGPDPLKGVRPYDLRHSFGSALFQTTGNLDTTGTFLQHADPRTTKRYALAAVDPVLTAALANWPARLPKSPEDRTVASRANALSRRGYSLESVGVPKSAAQMVPAEVGISQEKRGLERSVVDQRIGRLVKKKPVTP